MQRLREDAVTEADQHATVPGRRAAGRGRPLPRAEGHRVARRDAGRRRAADMPTFDLAELAAALAAKRRSRASSSTQLFLDRIARLEPGAQRLHHRRRGARRSRRRAPPTRASRAGEARPADRHPDRAQGHLLRRRLAHHLRLEDARELRRALRRARRSSASTRAGAVIARQDQHGRVRDGLVQRELVLRPGAQPLGPGARARRHLGRLGRGGGRAPRAGRDRHRHRRLDPPAGGAHAASPASSRPTAWCRATA